MQPHIAVAWGYLPILISVEDAGRKVVDVCARADEQQDDEEEGLEVEEGRLQQG